MRFALVENNRMEAVKGLKATCPNCGSEVVARCGEVKLHHWAHKSTRQCDSWWEKETEWHRGWKNSFPQEWQEIILEDSTTKEKHIADIRTSHELVVEFQHSYIDPQERRKRESFYKHMVWVVDGSRLKQDFARFLKNYEQLRPTQTRGVFTVLFPEECFPSAWIGCAVPVIVDFKGLATDGEPTSQKNLLYCMFPSHNRQMSVYALTRESFIENIRVGRWFSKQVEVEPEQQVVPTPSQTNPARKISPNHSSFVFHKGRYVPRKRF